MSFSTLSTIPIRLLSLCSISLDLNKILIESSITILSPGLNSGTKFPIWVFTSIYISFSIEPSE